MLSEKKISHYEGGSEAHKPLSANTWRRHAATDACSCQGCGGCTKPKGFVGLHTDASTREVLPGLRKLRW